VVLVVAIHPRKEGRRGFSQPFDKKGTFNFCSSFSFAAPTLAFTSFAPKAQKQGSPSLLPSFPPSLLPGQKRRDFYLFCKTKEKQGKKRKSK
jgi:hypothetical protein